MKNSKKVNKPGNVFCSVVGQSELLQTASHIKITGAKKMLPSLPTERASNTNPLKKIHLYYKGYIAKMQGAKFTRIEIGMKGATGLICIAVILYLVLLAILLITI